MKRTAVYLIILCILASCASSGGAGSRTIIEGAADFSTPSYGSILKTLPVGDAPVFFAAAPRMSEREAEIDECLKVAAAQASRFIAARASSYFLVKENNRDLLYLEDVNVQHDTELAESLVDDLTILREYQDRNGSYILAMLEGHPIGRIPYTPSRTGGQPSWVEDFPSIPGYYVGVGVTQRAGHIAASIANADDRAMEEIIKQISVSQMTDRRDVEVETVGTAFAQERREVSEAVILGFYIMDRWVSPDGINYFSLAVCPRDKNTRQQ